MRIESIKTRARASALYVRHINNDSYNVLENIKASIGQLKNVLDFSRAYKL